MAKQTAKTKANGAAKKGTRYKAPAEGAYKIIDHTVDVTTSQEVRCRQARY